MSERKYSVAEIDRMRVALKDCNYIWHAHNLEDRLRTYMLNGTDPEELEALAVKCLAEHDANMESSRREMQWEEEERLKRNASRFPSAKEILFGKKQ